MLWWNKICHYITKLKSSFILTFFVGQKMVQASQKGEDLREVQREIGEEIVHLHQQGLIQLDTFPNIIEKVAKTKTLEKDLREVEEDVCNLKS